MSSNLIQLWLVATPLGNTGDLSPRARQCLEESHAVLAEDTRRASLACQRWGLRPQGLISLHEHNESQKISFVLELLRQGKILALISDAGMPVLADPGYLLVRACRAEGFGVSVIPGPCAPVTALAASGIAPQPFSFLGFLPRKDADVESALAPFANIQTTLVFFDRKDRLAQSLSVVHRLLGKRQVCVARELTKVHEEFIHFDLDALPALDSLKGEITVIIGPPQSLERTSRTDVESVIVYERSMGGMPKEIARRVQSQVQGWTSSEVYALLPRRDSK